MYCIRKADKSDSLDIANIHFTSWGATYAKLLPESYISQNNDLVAKTEMWQELIAHPDVTVWVAYENKDDNRSVGFIGYYNKGDDYEITTLYVLPDYQNLGIGSQLMTAALTTISASNFIINCSSNLSLWVLENNLPAINFYRKFGFVSSGESSEESCEGGKIVDIKMVKVLDTVGTV